MHQNDRRPRTLFGKTYLWVEIDGRLCLTSVAAIKEIFDRAKAAIAKASTDG